MYSAGPTRPPGLVPLTDPHIHDSRPSVNMFAVWSLIFGGRNPRLPETHTENSPPPSRSEPACIIKHSWKLPSWRGKRQQVREAATPAPPESTDPETPWKHRVPPRSRDTPGGRRCEMRPPLPQPPGPPGPHTDGFNGGCCVCFRNVGLCETPVCSDWFPASSSPTGKGCTIFPPGFLLSSV